MANFSPSNLVAGQAVFNEKFKSGEWRPPDAAAIAIAQKGDVANPQLAELRKREDRAVNAYLPVRQDATDGTARAARHTGDRGDSVAEAITWTTFSEPFSISVKQADNNVLSWAEMYAFSLRNAIFNLLSRVDAWFVSQLVADKTGFNAGGGNGSFIEASDIYENPIDEKDYFFQNAGDSLMFNQYDTDLVGIVDAKAKTLMHRLQAQGSANATNFGFQFDAFSMLVPTTRTILGTSYDGSSLIWKNGLVAVIPWIPKQNRKTLSPDKVMSYVGDLGQISVPELGFPIAISAYTDRKDTSAKNGDVQDMLIEYELSFDIGYVSAIIKKNADETPVFAFGQLKEGGA